MRLELEYLLWPLFDSLAIVPVLLMHFKNFSLGESRTSKLINEGSISYDETIDSNDGEVRDSERIFDYEFGEMLRSSMAGRRPSFSTTSLTLKETL